MGSLSNLLCGIPPFPGKLRLVDAIGKFTSHIGDGRVTFSPCPGARLEVNLHDRIERQMWGGCYEAHVRNCLEALLRPGDVFLDIGAHIGYHAAVGACLVGAAGLVFAFEPDPILYERLVRNVGQFSFVRAVRCAVWESSGKFTFEQSSSAGESGWGTLTVVRDFRKGQHVTVDAVALDDWCDKYLSVGVRAIKIDAEGSEVGILKGARNLLRRLRPAIVLEMNEILLRQGGTSSAELRDHLLRLDYDLFGLRWPWLERLAEGQSRSTSEVLCLPSEQVAATLEILSRAGFRS